MSTYVFHYDKRSSTVRNDAGDRIAELSGVSDEYPGCGEMFAAAPRLLEALREIESALKGDMPITAQVKEIAQNALKLVAT